MSTGTDGPAGVFVPSVSDAVPHVYAGSGSTPRRRKPSLRETKIAGILSDDASIETSVSHPSVPRRLNTIRPL